MFQRDETALVRAQRVSRRRQGLQLVLAFFIRRRHRQIANAGRADVDAYLAERLAAVETEHAAANDSSAGSLRGWRARSGRLWDPRRGRSRGERGFRRLSLGEEPGGQ